MIKKIRLFLLFLILAFVLIFTISADKKISNLSALPEKEPEEKFAVGEEITYDVKLGKLRLGTSKFSRVDNSNHQEKSLYVMLFETNLATFSDKEKIYTDPKTFLPIIIERDIKNLFIKERIIETYDQNNFTLSIVKNQSGKDEFISIKSSEPIQNAILLPQQVRRLADLKPGLKIKANLPNRRYEITLTSIEDVVTPAGTFNAYHFESNPKQIEIWISTDERRIPVKIQSTATFGYFLILKEYKAPQKK